MAEKLSERIKAAYICHAEADLTVTDQQLLDWIAEAKAMECEIEELRLECGKDGS